MTPQHGASLAIVILATLEVSFKLLELSIMLLENIYVQALLMMIVIYDHHIFIVQATIDISLNRLINGVHRLSCCEC
jgi:hypothetical protein